MIRYSSEEINVIRKKSLKYVMSIDVINTIDSIVQKVGSPSYIKTPSFKKKKKSFEKIVERPPVERTMTEEVRGILNKFSGEKTYETLKGQLTKHIDAICEDESSSVSLADIMKEIFDAASIYNSNLYSKLCDDICNDHDICKTYIQNLFRDSKILYTNIQHANAETNYDAFCKLNAINEKLKKRSRFYTQLLQYNLLNMDDIMSVIRNLQTMLLEKGKLDTPDNNPCIEYSENIFIFMSECIEQLEKCDEFQTIINDIDEVKKMDRKVNKNITSKITFKQMDVLDLINKRKRDNE